MTQKTNPGSPPASKTTTAHGRSSAQELSPDDLLQVTGGVTVTKQTDVSSSPLFRDAVQGPSTKTKAD